MALPVSVYPDFPACLPAYAWLLSTGDHCFDTASRCKACGQDVPRNEWVRHLREHQLELARLKAKSRQEAAARLRTVNRLRKETA